MIGALVAKRAIKSAFEALNEGNLDKFTKAWSKDFIFIYPGRVKAGGKFTGSVDARSWFENFIMQFPQRKFTINRVGVTNMFDMAGNNTIFAELNVELTNKSGYNCSNSGISMIRLKKGKVVSAEDFLRMIDGEEYEKGWEDFD